MDAPLWSTLNLTNRDAYRGLVHESLNRMTRNKLDKDPTEWTEWTECSKWCEKGIQARQRLKASADITRGNRADIERKC